MSTAIRLTDVVVRVGCPWCAYAGCRACNGRGFMLRDPYAPHSGEQGDERLICPACIVGAGQCSRCNGSGFVYA